MPVDTAVLIVIVLRLLVPLTVFRWQLVGGILSLFADLSDTPLVYLLGGTFENYQLVDKLMDTYMMLIMLVVSLRWEKIARMTSILSFVYRGIGTFLFFITGQQWLFVVFPDFFTFFYLFYVIRNRFFSNYKLTNRKVIIILLLLLILKIIQEITLHVFHFTLWWWELRDLLLFLWLFLKTTLASTR